MIHHVVIPGLLASPPKGMPAADIPRFPAIERLLARADRRSAPTGYAQTLFERFGLSVPSGKDVPTAAVCLSAEDDYASDDPLGYCLHADPVFLRPDQDRLLAYDLGQSALTGEQSSEFVAAFNHHFQGDGLRLIAPHPMRWYLLVDDEPAIRTTPLHDVIGRNIDFFLPDGDDAGKWRGLLNEAQMLFHSLPVNRARVEDGQLPVSGLWVSGGGTAIAGQGKGFSQIAGDCRLLDGLVAATGESRSSERLTVVRKLIAGLSGEDWSAALQEVEASMADWLADTDGLIVYPCDGEAYEWSRSARRRFWRRRSALFNQA